MRFQSNLWIFLIFIVTIGTTALVAQPCTTNGTFWVSTCSGYQSPDGTSPMVAMSFLGVGAFDNSGVNFTLNGDLSLGGQPASQTASGTLALQPNCSGSITLQNRTVNGQAEPALHFAFLMQPDVTTIDLLNVDAGNVFACHLARANNVGLLGAPLSVPPPPLVITGVPTHPIANANSPSDKPDQPTVQRDNQLQKEDKKIEARNVQK